MTTGRRSRGRPLPLASGDPASGRLRKALLERPERRTEVRPVARIESAASDAARRFWSERAWSEYAAVPAMAQTALAVVRDGGPLDVLDALALIGSDEVRHTELSRNLADAFGGYVDEIPESSGYNPQLMALPYEMSTPFWAISNGCISETVSLEMMRVRLPFTTHPVVRETLETILKDEHMHARLSWMLAEQLFPKLDDDCRRDLAEYAGELFAVMPKSFATKELPPAERRRQRKIRTQVFEAGLGAASPDEEDAAFYRIRDEVICPRLRKLGIPI